MAERGSDSAAREHWQASLQSALKARATELAAVAPGDTDAVDRALLVALEAAKAAAAWTEVAQLAHALEGHRRARAAVPSLDAARRRSVPRGKRT